MILIIGFLTVAIVWVMYRLADDYVTRASRSYKLAEMAWNRATLSAREFLEGDVSPDVARLVLEIAALAGCGCFVRGLIVSHYLPKTHIKTDGSGMWDTAFTELDNLDAESRRKFSEFLTRVIVYDGYTNPLSGWILRKLIVPSGDSSPSLRMETQLTAYSVVSKRRSSLDAKPFRVPQAA